MPRVKQQLALIFALFPSAAAERPESDGTSALDVTGCKKGVLSSDQTGTCSTHPRGPLTGLFDGADGIDHLPAVFDLLSEPDEDVDLSDVELFCVTKADSRGNVNKPVYHIMSTEGEGDMIERRAIKNTISTLPCTEKQQWVGDNVGKLVADAVLDKGGPPSGSWARLGSAIFTSVGGQPVHSDKSAGPPILFVSEKLARLILQKIQDESEKLKVEDEQKLGDNMTTLNANAMFLTEQAKHMDEVLSSSDFPLELGSFTRWPAHSD